MKLNVGLIGIGNDWETRHRPALKSLSDRFSVKGVFSENSVKSERVADDFATRHYNGFRSLIQREEIEAILFLSNGWGGELPVYAACQFGKAIYSASLFDMSSANAAKFKQRIENSGVAFMAEFARRCTPATLRLKELIATRLGRPRMIFCNEHLTQHAPSEKPANRTDRKLLLELVDWCRYIVDHSVSSVFSTEHQFPMAEGSSEFKQINLSFESDIPDESSIAQIRIARLVPHHWQDAHGYRRPAAIQVTCENGVAYIDSPTTIIWFDDAGQHTESLEADRPVGEQLLTLFHRSVTSLVRRTNDLEAAFLASLIVDQAEESCRTRQPIPVPTAGSPG